MAILQRIFTGHYEEIISTLHPIKTEIDNIDKMIKYVNYSFGGVMYCNNFNFSLYAIIDSFTPYVATIFHTMLLY